MNKNEIKDLKTKLTRIKIDESTNLEENEINLFKWAIKKAKHEFTEKGDYCNATLIIKKRIRIDNKSKLEEIKSAIRDKIVNGNGDLQGDAELINEKLKTILDVNDVTPSDCPTYGCDDDVEPPDGQA